MTTDCLWVDNEESVASRTPTLHYGGPFISMLQLTQRMHTKFLRSAFEGTKSSPTTHRATVTTAETNQPIRKG